MKIKNYFVTHTFLFNLLLTIIGIACVPILLIQIFISRNAFRELNMKNDTYYQSTAEYTANRFYEQLDLLKNTAFSISQDREIYCMLSEEVSPYTVLELNQCLNEFLRPLPIVNSLGVYYKSKNVVVSNYCRYPLEEYCLMLSGFDTSEVLQLTNFFKGEFSQQYGIFAVLEEDEKNATLIITVPVFLTNYYSYDAVVFFSISLSSFQTYLKSALTGIGTSYAFLTSSGDVLFCDNADYRTFLETQEYGEYLCSSANHGIYHTNSRGDNINFYHYTDEKTGSTFVSIIPQSEVEQDALAFYRNTKNVLLVSFLCILLFFVLMVYYNYRPFSKLISQLNHSIGNSNIISEFKTIEESIRLLDSKASEQTLFLMDNLLGYLLYDTPLRSDQWRSFVKYNKYTSYCIAYAFCDHLDNAESGEISKSIFTKATCMSYISDFIDRPETLLFCASTSPIDKDALYRTILEAFQERNKSCILGIGDVISDIEQIKTSFFEAISDLDSQRRPKTQIQQSYDPAQTIQSLIQCVKAGDEAEAKAQLNAIFAALQSTHIANEKYYRYDLIVALVKLRNEMGFEISPATVSKILSYQNEEALKQMLRVEIHEACEKISRLQQDRNSQLKFEFVQYLNEHYTDHDISLVTVSDHFHLSIYMFSRLFKSYVGIGFKEYLISKRLEFARQLLATTKTSISEIASQAGFENVSYFSTLFRTHFGVSPSQYRQQNISANV